MQPVFVASEDRTARATAAKRRSTIDKSLWAVKQHKAPRIGLDRPRQGRGRVVDLEFCGALRYGPPLRGVGVVGEVDIVRPEERRQQLLDSAREVFSEKGYHRSSVADIIARAGVARGTFYLYFKSKRDVFEELLDLLLTLIEGRIRLVDVDSGPAQVLSELRDNLDGVLEVMVGNHALTRILLHEAVGLDQGFDDKLHHFYGQVHALIAESLELGQRMHLIRPLDTQLAARFLLGSLKELLFDVTLSGEPLEDVAHATDELLVFLLRGIAEPAVIEAIR